MALLTPLWMQAGAGDPDIHYSALLDRQLIGSVFSREGVGDKDANHLRVSQRAEGANMSVDIAPGKCTIFGDDVANQGAYLCVSTTKVNLSIPAPPPSGSRTHRVVAQVRDKLHNGAWSTYDWVIRVLPDTGSGTPGIPSSAVSLALVTVAAGAVSVTSANISDNRARATVGTPNVTGSLIPSGKHPAYGGEDTTRPNSFQKTPDGWVFLSGWFRRAGANTNLSANTIYYLDGAGGANPYIPVEGRPTGTRDFYGITDVGDCHYIVYASGAFAFRFNRNVTLQQNQTWFSLDGCSYRASSF